MKNIMVFLALSVFVLCSSCEQNASTSEAAPETETKTEVNKEGMIKVTIMYPNGEDKTFDMDYYKSKHMPMLQELYGDALKLIEIDKGIAGRTPDEAIPYLAIGYLHFDNLKAYQEGVVQHIEQIRADIPNYTNIIPVVQISEVVQ